MHFYSELSCCGITFEVTVVVTIGKDPTLQWQSPTKVHICGMNWRVKIPVYLPNTRQKEQCECKSIL